MDPPPTYLTSKKPNLCRVKKVNLFLDDLDVEIACLFFLTLFPPALFRPLFHPGGLI